MSFSYLLILTKLLLIFIATQMKYSMNFEKAIYARHKFIRFVNIKLNLFVCLGKFIIWIYIALSELCTIN